MDSNKSLDEYKLIAALLHDAHALYVEVFNTVALRKTLNKVQNRVTKEGVGFLTKTLPRLGKALDKALCGHKLNCIEYGFKPMPGTKLPKLFGEFFSRVLSPDGAILPHPCTTSVRVLRQLLYLFYKYELPYTDDQELSVLEKFVRTDQELHAVNERLSGHFADIMNDTTIPTSRRRKSSDFGDVVREARILLSRAFASFDPNDILPRHGPGVVATKQQLWDKYRWTNVSAKITKRYPLDAYFYASLGHVCDRLNEFNSLSEVDLPARVLLVPKDSRGPRLISCEPVDYQWIQQGLGRAIVRHVENNKLTKFNVFFTNQQPNQHGALLGSYTGWYATLDLNEASDRVSVGLIRLLWPDHLYKCLMACRSSSTELPNGDVINLNKYAPMGSCLCFPVMACTIWAILTAAAPDADTRESILVYGDDVIVPADYSACAIEQLESFGLKINHDKSCTNGLFRESCGTDAFVGAEVTPVRLRTVWSSSRSPGVYTSWIAYANSFYDRHYFAAYDYIVGLLHAVYGAIPTKDMSLTCPSLNEVSEQWRNYPRRVNSSLQRLEYRVWDVVTPSVTKYIDGWSMLLRYFAELAEPNIDVSRSSPRSALMCGSKTSASQYTRRDTSMLVKRWR